MSIDEIDHICQDLPIFPLPRLVLMPGRKLPLHIFEPRYREMLQYCLTTHKMLAIATLADDSGTIHPELGIGRIIQHEPLEDGRSNIVLEYVASATLVSEHDVDTPFRRVIAHRSHSNAQPDAHAITTLRALTIQLLAPSPSSPLRQQLTQLEGEPWLDAMAGALFRDHISQRAYLIAADTHERVTLVEAAVLELVSMGQSSGDA